MGGGSCLPTCDWVADRTYESGALRTFSVQYFLKGARSLQRACGLLSPGPALWVSSPGALEAFWFCSGVMFGEGCAELAEGLRLVAPRARVVGQLPGCFGGVLVLPRPG